MPWFTKQRKKKARNTKQNTKWLYFKSVSTLDGDESQFWLFQLDSRSISAVSIYFDYFGRQSKRPDSGRISVKKKKKKKISNVAPTHGQQRRLPHPVSNAGSSMHHRFLMKVSILVNGSILVLLWLILIWDFNSSC